MTNLQQCTKAFSRSTRVTVETPFSLLKGWCWLHSWCFSTAALFPLDLLQSPQPGGFSEDSLHKTTCFLLRTVLKICPMGLQLEYAVQHWLFMSYDTVPPDLRVTGKVLECSGGRGPRPVEIYAEERTNLQPLPQYVLFKNLISCV